MKIGIDIGASNTKIVGIEDRKIIFKKIFPTSKDFDFSQEIKEYRNIKSINITGGNTDLYPKDINNIECKAVNEIEAIAKGVRNDDCLIASLGTGTCLIDKSDGKAEHIGGTSTGGGAYKGLSILCTKIDSYDKLDQLSGEGNIDNIDLKIKDIKGKNIGILNKEITASNFGKVKKDKNPKDSDIILGIQNMIAETIFSIVYFASKSRNKEKIILIGKLIEVPTIKKRILELSEEFKIRIEIEENPAYCAAIGAAEY